LTTDKTKPGSNYQGTTAEKKPPVAGKTRASESIIYKKRSDKNKGDNQEGSWCLSFRHPGSAVAVFHGVGPFSLVVFVARTRIMAVKNGWIGGIRLTFALMFSCSFGLLFVPAYFAKCTGQPHKICILYKSLLPVVEHYFIFMLEMGHRILVSY
jgi:hypothetical protein